MNHPRLTRKIVNYTNSIVSRLCNRYDIPPWEKAEIAGIARFKLVEIDRGYNPDKGTAFTSYLWLRIEGIVKDYVRSMMRTRCKGTRPTFVSFERLTKQELMTGGFSTNGTSNRVITQDLVDKILCRLPDNYVQVLCLYYLEGLEMKEIGALKGCGEAAVSKLCKTARARARQVYRRLERREARK